MNNEIEDYDDLYLDPYLEPYLERFQDVVKFLVVNEILKKYQSFDEYTNAPNSDKACKLHSAISTKLLTSLGRIYNERFALKFIKQSKNIFKYHFHRHNQYKSVKKFARNSWFEMNLEIVKFAFDNKEDWNIANDELFSKAAHKWVDKKVFKYTEEDNMTKLEKIQYQKDYEAGLKAFPLEVVLKDEAKKKRANDKRLETKVKKMTQQAMVEEEIEIQRLKKENEQLRARISYLESLKDLNSDIPKDDIPEDDVPASIEYKDIDKYFPDGIDEDDPNQKDLIARISDDCWNKINEEGEQEKRMLEEKEKNFDYEKEMENVKNMLKNFPKEEYSENFARKRDANETRTLTDAEISAVVEQTIPTDDIPETFDDHREGVANAIAHAIKNGIVGLNAGRHFLKMIGCENYRLPKIPEQLEGSFCNKKQLAFVEWLYKQLMPFENEFDKADKKWLIQYYRELKIAA